MAHEPHPRFRSQVSPQDLTCCRSSHQVNSEVSRLSAEHLLSVPLRLPPAHYLQRRLVLHPHAVEEPLPDFQEFLLAEASCRARQHEARVSACPAVARSNMLNSCHCGGGQPSPPPNTEKPHWHGRNPWESSRTSGHSPQLPQPPTFTGLGQWCAGHAGQCTHEQSPSPLQEMILSNLTFSSCPWQCLALHCAHRLYFFSVL